MKTISKDPDEVVDFWLDYSKRLGTDTILSLLSVTVTPSSTLEVIEAQINDTDIQDDRGHTIKAKKIIALWFAGGILNTNYNVNIKFNTLFGRTYDDDVLVRCANEPIEVYPSSLTIIKDPDEVVDYWLDYTKRVGQDKIVSVPSITITPPGEVEVRDINISEVDTVDDRGQVIRAGKVISVFLIGGVLDSVYNMHVTFITFFGRTYDDDVLVKCLNDTSLDDLLAADPDKNLTRLGGKSQRVIKDPDEIVDFWFDYTDRLGTDRITEVTFYEIDVPEELSIQKVEISSVDTVDDAAKVIRSGQLLSVWLEGGEQGRTYNLHIEFKTQFGRIYDDDVIVDCLNDTYDYNQLKPIIAPDYRVIKQGGNKHQAKIYGGRDNVLRLIILDAGQPVEDITQTTRAVFTLITASSDAVQTLDTDASPKSINCMQGGGIIEVQTQALTIVRGAFYSGELTLYNYAHKNGVLVVDRQYLLIEGA